jgi:hypothetical protein
MAIVSAKDEHRAIGWFPLVGPQARTFGTRIAQITFVKVLKTAFIS